MTMTVDFEGYDIEVEVTSAGCRATFDHPGDPMEFEITSIHDEEGEKVTEQAMRDELEMGEADFMNRFDVAVSEAFTEHMQNLEMERALSI